MNLSRRDFLAAASLAVPFVGLNFNELNAYPNDSAMKFFEIIEFKAGECLEFPLDLITPKRKVPIKIGRWLMI